MNQDASGQNLRIQAYTSLISTNLSYLPSLHFTVYLCIVWPWLYMGTIYSTTTNLCPNSWLSTEHPTSGTELLKDIVNVKTCSELVPGDR